MKFVSPATSPIQAHTRGRRSRGVKPRGRNALLAFLAADAVRRARNWWYGGNRGRVRRSRLRVRLGPPSRGVRNLRGRKKRRALTYKKRRSFRRTKFLRGTFQPYRWSRR